MLTVQDEMKQPREDRLDQLQRAADELAAAIGDGDDTALSRRPDATNWAAKEVVCHLRDAEEFFLQCLEAMIRQDEPEFGGPSNLADRWAEERQYLRNDTDHALRVFQKHRTATLAFLGARATEDWERGGSFGELGRMTVAYLLAVIAWHDANHRDQLGRALDGRA